LTGSSGRPMSSYLQSWDCSTVSSTQGPGAGRWPSLRPPMALARAALAFEGNQSLCTMWSKRPPVPPSWPSSERPNTYRFASSRFGVSALPMDRKDHWPCTSALARTPLSGFQRSPLHRHSYRASTPGWSFSKRPTALRFGVATLRTCSVPAVPPSFDGLRRIDSLRVCCTPQPVMGFAMFPVPMNILLQA
jgi:hypothetical protein